MCFGPSAPALWFSLSESERETRANLSSDQCVIDEKHFFILGRILLPVIDAPAPFVWLAWVALSEQNFLRANELWNSESRESEPPYFSWLQSALPYKPPTLGLKTSLQTMPAGERPNIILGEADHPLYFEQRNGINLLRVQQIAEAALHG